MNKQKKLKKTISFLFLVLLFCWCAMTTTDFILSRQAKAPIFSINQEVTDMDLYRGLGYTIIIRFNGVFGEPDEELKGYFYWGWQ